jgi:GntR family transcriptional regulator
MQLRVNRNTVAKAYAELEAQGVIETVAGKGCFVKSSASPLRKQVRDQMVVVEIDQAIVAAHHLGVKRDEFVGLVNERLDDFEERAAAARVKEK